MITFENIRDGVGEMKPCPAQGGDNSCGSRTTLMESYPYRPWTNHTCVKSRCPLMHLYQLIKLETSK
jgi:hypothetical protein